MMRKPALAHLLLALATATACAEGEGIGTSYNPTTVTITSAASAQASITGAGTTDDDTGGGTDSDGPPDPTATSTSTGASTSTAGAPVCGDGVRDFGEECDGLDLVGKDCQSFGWDDGVLACNPDCTFFIDACFRCGDGIKDMAEACDGDDLGGRTCASEGYGGGALTCDPDCKGVDTAACTPLQTCGDGVLDGNELCDGGQLGGQTCVSLGYDQGTLACTAACTFDTRGCMALECAGQGELCLFNEDDLQSNCCPPGVKGNVVGICNLIVCL